MLAVVVPLAFLLPARTASTAVPDDTAGRATIAASWTLAEATRSGMFWVIATAIATSGMLTTALGFHQIAVLGEQGLSSLEAAANFLPQTITSLLATLLVGSLIDRSNPRVFIAFSMATLIAALLMLPLVAPGVLGIVYGLVVGAAGGALRGMEAAVYVRYYGPVHIGSIRGLAIGIGLASTAIGPIALSLGRDLAGTFNTPAAIAALIPASVAIASLVIREPTRTGKERTVPAVR